MFLPLLPWFISSIALLADRRQAEADQDLKDALIRSGYPSPDALLSDLRIWRDLEGAARSIPERAHRRPSSASDRGWGEVTLGWNGPTFDPRSIERMRSLETDYARAAETGDLDALLSIDDQSAALQEELEGIALQQDERGDDADNIPDPEDGYWRAWRSGIGPYREGVVDWTTVDTWPFHFDSREDWLRALQSRVENWYDEPGLSIVPRLRKQPTEQDLIELGEEIDTRRYKVRTSRPVLTPPFDREHLEYKAVLAFAVLTRLGRVPLEVLSRFGWTGAPPLEIRKAYAGPDRIRHPHLPRMP